MCDFALYVNLTLKCCILITACYRSSFRFIFILYSETTLQSGICDIETIVHVVRGSEPIVGKFCHCVLHFMYVFV